MMAAIEMIVGACQRRSALEGLALLARTFAEEADAARRGAPAIWPSIDV